MSLVVQALEAFLAGRRSADSLIAEARLECVVNPNAREEWTAALTENAHRIDPEVLATFERELGFTIEAQDNQIPESEAPTRMDLVEPSPPPAEPELINGRYVLEELVGRGGMGEVWAARDLVGAKASDPNALCAIKLLGDAVRDSEGAKIALQREASRARNLRHQNIVAVYDFGPDGDGYYFSMELLRGRPLESLLKERPSGLSFEEARPIIRAICAGLSYAHQEGVIHSDVKPSNIFLTDAGVTKLLDFGIAAPMRRLRSDQDPTLFDPRAAGALTARYAPLEMFLRMSPDPRDDVYSTACVIYEMLSGRHPYGGDEAPRALERDLQANPIASLSGEQNRLLQAALEFKREDRLGTIESLAAVVEPGGEVQKGATGGDPIDWWRWRWAIVGLGASLVAVVALLWPVSDPPPLPPETSVPSVDPNSPVVAQTSLPLAPPPAPTRRDYSGGLEGILGLPANAECGDLESRWAFASCEEKTRCFARRALSDEAAAFIERALDGEDRAGFVKVRSLYQRLSQTACGALDSEFDAAFADLGDWKLSRAAPSRVQ